MADITNMIAVFIFVTGIDGFMSFYPTVTLRAEYTFGISVFGAGFRYGSAVFIRSFIMIADKLKPQSVLLCIFLRCSLSIAADCNIFN